VGISLEERAIHKGSRVTFIRITDNVLDLSRSLRCEFPFRSGGESCPTPTPQARELYLFDNLFAAHIEQGMRKSLISVPGNVFVDLVRVDDPAIAKGNSDLLAVERISW